MLDEFNRPNPVFRHSDSDTDEANEDNVPPIDDDLKFETEN